jgi:hypothetical protein
MTRNRASFTRFRFAMSLIGAGVCTASFAASTGCDGEMPDVGLSSTSPGLAKAGLVANAAGDPDDPVNAPPQLVEKAKDLLAARTGQPRENITISNAAPATFPLQNISLYAFSAFDSLGKDYSISLSPDGSQEFDDLAIAAAEQALYEEANGKLTPDLVAQMAGLADSVELDVALRAVIPAGAEDGGPTRPAPTAQLTPAQAAAVFASVDAFRAQVARTATSTLQSRLLRMGRTAQVSPVVPIVQTRLPVSLIREAGRWPEVNKVFTVQQYSPTMAIARSVVDADVVNARGFEGSGFRVAAMEKGGYFPGGNPYLVGVTGDSTFPVCDSSPPGHATAVAGVVRSTHSSVRGVAPSAGLRIFGTCAGYSWNFHQLAQNALQNTAPPAAPPNHHQIFNLSFTSDGGSQPGDLDNLYDDMVQNNWRTVVAAVGNKRTFPFPVVNYVGSPARGYNSIAVGSINDNNTIPWLGDVMSTFSRWQNPVSPFNDHEKPDVVAPGTNIQTTSPISPWDNAVVSGTSMSAPQVSATAALMMHRNPGIQFWPEALKAVLMATAVHNIEGASRLSEQDGAGAIVDSLADDVVHGVSGNWGGISYSCASPPTLTLTTLPLVANRVVRVVISWDSDAGYNQYASQPSADLNLQVQSPVIGTSPGYYFLYQSSRRDATTEIIELTAPVSGIYTVKVKKRRCDMAPKWLGWAWYQNY